MGHIFLNPLTESAHIMVSTMVWVGGIIRPLFPLGSRGWACSGAFLRYFSGQELAPPLTGAATAFIRCDGRGRLEDNWKRSRKGVGGGAGRGLQYMIRTCFHFFELCGMHVVYSMCFQMHLPSKQFSNLPR